MQRVGIDNATDTLFWFRRDLRLDDNTGLIQALKNGVKIQPIFIFDTELLDALPSNDARVSFIYNCLESLQQSLVNLGSSLLVYHGVPKAIFDRISQQFPSLKQVFWNRDYTPYAKQRDQEVMEGLNKQNIQVATFKDHVVLEPHEVLKADGLPYTVFTPYANKWRSVLDSTTLDIQSLDGLSANLTQSSFVLPSLKSIGFDKQELSCSSEYPNERIIELYESLRDFPAEKGTSKMSLALRFGTISIRKLFLKSLPISRTYTNELIWREFYQMILWYYPNTVTEEFKPKYASIPWRNSEADFDLWKNGNTGVALVDAGMRELNATGFMHNRVRMIVAGFLCKNLLLDWRWGEAYFAEKLLDYELASNVGGWQWAASCGCDAAPYFRVFNPETQAKKFDPNSEYIRRWVPEYQSADYQPMVDIKQSRKDCIEIYKHTLSQAK
jgi:deoxyribodipyrimidine photo-lyase